MQMDIDIEKIIDLLPVCKIIEDHPLLHDQKDKEEIFHDSEPCRSTTLGL